MQWIEWTRCPQCGQIAEVVDRDVWPSTDGPIEHVHVRCVRRHRFVMPVVSLAREHEDTSTWPWERVLAQARRPGAIGAN